jgi:hypothetical protein
MFNGYFVITGLGYNICLIAKILVCALEELLTCEALLKECGGFIIDI